MTTTDFEKLIDTFLTPDLRKMTKVQLMYEVAWMRYLYGVVLTRQYIKRARGGKRRGKQDGTTHTVYQQNRLDVARLIRALHEKEKPISIKVLHKAFEKRTPPLSDFVIKAVYEEWNKDPTGFLSRLLALDSTQAS